ncbi:hypothetical protein [Pseudomonas sp. ADAK18]|uniref:hypothetical protein n=1 Tax=Pseudomonas sp. ADAK18 TaxID=2730848 RepID=UPI0015B53A0E|nr:hypothetical protein [Pseudomonas sp. ADAK18]
MEARTLFIKASRITESMLDPVHIARNKSANIETTISLDTNMLISMEKVVKHGNKWASVKKQGLHNLVKLLHRCPPQSVCLSPGLALSEMPPELARQASDAYELFCAQHLPQFIDTPNAVHTLFQGKKEDYGYDDLSSDAKVTLAVPYASLIYLNVADRMKLKPFDKFKWFIDNLEAHVDILSATEIEIAKYCFAEPDAHSRETIELRRKVRNNFLKTGEEKLPVTVADVKAIAFNGASDIRLLHAANITDQNGLDGVPQDCWIATKDKKLVDFCSVFHHLKADGEAGKYAAKVVHTEHVDDHYWLNVDRYAIERVMQRSHHHDKREIDHQQLLNAVDSALNAATLAFG